MPIHVDHILSIGDLPRECVEDCHAPGQDAAPAVQHWREKLGFTVDRERAIKHLAGYGAWERDELAGMDDNDLAERVLWLACGGFREYIIECERAGVDPYGERPDDFDPPAGSDIHVLE